MGDAVGPVPSPGFKRARDHVLGGGVLLLHHAIDPARPIEMERLTSVDRADLQRLHFQRDRRRLAWSRRVMRHGFAMVGLHADAVLARTPSGRPYLAGEAIRFSCSRATTHVASAFALVDLLGLDIECRTRLGPPNDLIPEMMTAGEAADACRLRGKDHVDAVLVTWTRKEAVLKALGCGLAIAPNSFAIDYRTGAVSGLDAGGGWCFDERWLSQDVHCTIATGGDQTPSVLAIDPFRIV